MSLRRHFQSIHKTYTDCPPDGPNGIFTYVLKTVLDAIDQVPADDDFLFDVSYLIADHIKNGRLTIGLVYKIDHSHEAVFILDGDERASNFNGVRLIAWATDDGYVSSDMVSPW